MMTRQNVLDVADALIAASLEPDGWKMKRRDIVRKGAWKWPKQEA